MERLTERVGENERTVVYVGEHKQYDGGDFPCEISDAAKREVLKRLAAYEDTGLTPDEVEGIKALATLGIMSDVKRAIAIMDAEREGRLVVLPCKVGDFLYEIDLPEYGVIKCKVLSVDYYNGPLAHVPNNEMVELWSVGVEVVEGHGTGSCYAFEQTDFGKTVFLQREDAEKALEAQGER